MGFDFTAVSVLLSQSQAPQKLLKSSETSEVSVPAVPSNLLPTSAVQPLGSVQKEAADQFFAHLGTQPSSTPLVHNLALGEWRYESGAFANL
jgi:hypothetical protein